MTEPRKCTEPGCGRTMEEQFTRCIDADGNAGVAWVCPATPEQHELAALRARNAEQQAQLDEAHKREVVLIEALIEYGEHDQECRFEPCTCGLENMWADTQSRAESATAWLKAHDREVLEKPMALLAQVAAMMNGEDWMNFQGGLTGFKRMGMTYLARDVRAAVAKEP